MIMNQPIISLTGADPSGGNCGLGALAYGAFEFIYRNHPEAKLVLLDYYKVKDRFQYKDSGKVYSIERIGFRFSWKPYLRNNILYLFLGAIIIKLIPFSITKKTVSFLFPHIKKITSIKQAYSIAGGDSFSDIYGIQRFIYVVLPMVLYKILDIPVVHLPQTYGPYKSIFNRFIAKRILSGADKIFARDEISLNLVRELIGKKDTITLMYDVGFLLKPEVIQIEDFYATTHLKNRKQNVVGINVNGLLFKGGYTGRNQFNLLLNYEQLCYSLIDLFIKKFECYVLLIPHVFSHSYESDVYACNEINKNYNNNRVLFKDIKMNTKEVKGLIGNCDFFIGARMHACIAATSQCIPTVPLAYSRKFEGVMKTIGIETNVIDLRKINAKSVLEKIEIFYSKKNELSFHMEKTIPMIIKEIID